MKFSRLFITTLAIACSLSCTMLMSMDDSDDDSDDTITEYFQKEQARFVKTQKAGLRTWRMASTAFTLSTIATSCAIYTAASRASAAPSLAANIQKLTALCVPLIPATLYWEGKKNLILPTKEIKPLCNQLHESFPYDADFASVGANCLAANAFFSAATCWYSIYRGNNRMLLLGAVGINVCIELTGQFCYFYQLFEENSTASKFAECEEIADYAGKNYSLAEVCDYLNETDGIDDNGERRLDIQEILRGKKRGNTHHLDTIVKKKYKAMCRKLHPDKCGAQEGSPQYHAYQEKFTKMDTFTKALQKYLDDKEDASHEAPQQAADSQVIDEVD